MPRKPAPTVTEKAEKEPTVTEQVDGGAPPAEQADEPTAPETDDDMPDDEQPAIPEQIDDETRYQRALAAQRRAAYQREHDGNVRAGHLDRADAVRTAYETEFGEPMPESAPLETAKDATPRQTGRADRAKD